MTASSLFAIKQRLEELLRDYFRRFTAAKSQIRGLSDSTIMDAAKQGVLEGTEFFSKLSRKHITSVEKLPRHLYIPVARGKLVESVQP